MIGHVRERYSLYYLKESSGHDRTAKFAPLSFLIESSKSRKEKIWLQHLRFSHPSFSVLRLMFPSLFKGLVGEDFHCDICEFAKHKRGSFLVNMKMNSSPFALIHSDTWGPSPISNTTKARSRWKASMKLYYDNKFSH